MAERVLSIEMGNSLTKVIETDLGAKSPKIYNSFVVTTPEGMLKDGIVDTDDEFVNTFLRMLTVKRIKTRRAVFTITSSKIATREARIPYCKENKIKDLVRTNLNDYFPIDGSQYMFSHSIIGLEYEAKDEDNTAIEEKKKDDSKAPMTKAEQVKAELDSGTVKVAGKSKRGKPIGYKLLLLAAPKQLIQSYEKLAQAIGLSIAALDYNGNSVFQAAKDECHDGVQLIVKVDEKSTLLMVLEDGATTLNRTIPYGVDEAIKGLMATDIFGDTKDYEKAVNIARTKQTLMPSFEECDTEDPKEEFAVRSELTLTLRSLTGGIIRVIDYYNANHNQRPVEKMLITGLGANFTGLDVLLTSEIGLKIRDITRVAGVDIDRIFRGATYSEFVGCVGAVLAPIGFYPDSAEEEDRKGRDANSTGNAIAWGVLAAGVIASIAMIAVTMVPYMQEQETNESYKKTIEELQPVYDMYLDYLELENDVKYVEALDSATVNRNESINKLLGSLENNMPSTFMLNSLVATPAGVTLDATVATKEEVAYALSKLKMTEGCITADLASVSEMVQEETGEVKYSFVADLTYSPMEEEVTEDVAYEQPEEEPAQE
jgi:type IV pilus assembly protein PilM